jgi:hypothetical protein
MLAELKGHLLVILNSIIFFEAELNIYVEYFEVSMKIF